MKADWWQTILMAHTGERVRHMSITTKNGKAGVGGIKSTGTSAKGKTEKDPSAKHHVAKEGATKTAVRAAPTTKPATKKKPAPPPAKKNATPVVITKKAGSPTPVKKAPPPPAKKVEIKEKEADKKAKITAPITKAAAPAHKEKDSSTKDERSAKENVKDPKAALAKKVEKAEPTKKAEAVPPPKGTSKAKTGSSESKASGDTKAGAVTVPAVKAAPIGVPSVIQRDEPEYRPPAAPVYSEEDLVRFKQMLVSERDKVLDKARQTVEEGAIIVDRNEMLDEVDQATQMTEQNLTFRLLDRDRKLLTEIEHALGKIETGEFGYCEGTGEPIPKRRLELRPWTRHSVKYKEKLERMEKQGRGVVDEDEVI